MIFSEIREYKALEHVTKETLEEEADRLQKSLPFYFFTVKYNYLIFLTSLTDKGSRRKKHQHLPKHNYSDGLFTIMLETDSYSYSYKDKQWYFSSSKYPCVDRIGLTDEDYIESFTRLVRKIYGIYFIFPFLARKGA